jgi:putative membrane protein
MRPPNLVPFSHEKAAGGISVDMDYPLLKTVHIIAAVLVMFGVLVTAIAVSRPLSAEKISLIRRWDRYVTIPALGAVWILGLILAAEGNWFRAGWLPTKLVFVVALSALQGMQAASLRRMQSGGRPLAFLRFSPLLVIGLTAAILLLVVLKPF